MWGVEMSPSLHWELFERVSAMLHTMTPLTDLDEEDEEDEEDDELMQVDGGDADDPDDGQVRVRGAVVLF